MSVHISASPQELGQQAAQRAAAIIREAIAAKGRARIALSTGASQFEFFKAFVQADIPWDKVDMFHLDEYIGIDETHKASFRKYLKERFLQNVSVRSAHLVNGEGDVQATIAELNAAISAEPIDLGVIGIGENAHIAFNDPPADFDTEQPYIVVQLDDDCKRQQVGEGWFPTLADVPKEAISMSVKQILKSEHIISCVPYAVKAKAVRIALKGDMTPQNPAAILRTHAKWDLYLDTDSAALLQD